MCRHASIAIFMFLSFNAVASDYDRKDWTHWIDVDKDCQNQRHELLIAHSLLPVTFTNDRRCTVKTGLWIGPYTNQPYTKASDLDIDHIVPLKEAYDSGGATWTPTLRLAFANDPENLLIVDDGLNQAKGAKDPAAWFDVADTYKCTYLEKWRSIKSRYNLTMDETEKAFIFSHLKAC